MFKRAIITSGPTIEPIDPIRFISNRSSGKTGFYLAEEAKKREIEEIYFITGPSNYLPSGVNLVQVETTLEMRSKILKLFNETEVIIMAAAISDFKSAKYYSEKIKKSVGKLTLKLVKTPDILYELGQNVIQKQILVGFAAETENIFENATKKFKEKNVDLLVLNEISDKNPAFDDDYNQIYFVTKNGIKKYERKKKSMIATHIWDEIFNIAKEKNIY